MIAILTPFEFNWRKTLIVLCVCDSTSSARHHINFWNLVTPRVGNTYAIYAVQAYFNAELTTINKTFISCVLLLCAFISTVERDELKYLSIRLLLKVESCNNLQYTSRLYNTVYKLVEHPIRRQGRIEF